MTISALDNNRPSTAQVGPQDEGGRREDGDWLKRARDAYRDSTSYVDNNYRKQWDDSIRAFNNQHAADSKYNQPSYEKRSRLYRPKMRSIIRKNEAAAAAAFFSSMDVVSILPIDESNKMEVASSEVMKQLMQYRLTKSIPWYQVVIGGLQDAQNVGVACAHIYWDYLAGIPPEEPEDDSTESETSIIDGEYPSQRGSKLPEGADVVNGDHQELPDQLSMGDPTDIPPPSQDEYKNYDEVKGEKTSAEAKPRVDKPAVDLIPVENLRIDPGANWTDPINTSPYLIHLLPMYVFEVKARIATGEWRKISDSVIRQATMAMTDSTRIARGKDREDQYQPDGKSLPEYETVWVQRHIHKVDNEDYEFYTMGDIALLSEPVLLRDVVFHGKRPYVMGCCVLETHKVYPSSLPMLGKGLTDEANEVVNQRIDNVKFVLNKKFFAKRGQEIDVGGLVRNVPGGVVMMNDPVNDVREISWPDVTASAYEEQKNIDQDLNDLLGNFSAGAVMADKGINAPARNMAMLGQSTGTLVEYLLRTYVETFVQPILRQLVLLEQEYETDQTILAVASKKAQLFQKFGMDEVTDELLSQELSLMVNVGMGATDPQMKLQKFLSAMTAVSELVKSAPPGMNIEEVNKEVFGCLGYQDGKRFFSTDNPQVLQLQHQLQQSAQVIQQLNAKLQEKLTIHQVKKESAEIVSKASIQKQQIKEDNENLRASVIHATAIRNADKEREHDAIMAGVQHHQSLEHKGLDHAHTIGQTNRQQAIASAQPPGPNQSPMK